jgi:hypothetical protein
MASSDWEIPPTVEGYIVRAEISDTGDVIHVQPEKVAKNIGNLLRIGDDPDFPNPNRPFCVVGKSGTLKFHGYVDAKDLQKKHCLLLSGGRFDMVSIEKLNGEQGEWMIWCEYI